MGGTPWDDLELTPDPSDPCRCTATLSEPWQLAVAAQGGIVAALAARAMGAVLGEGHQTLRTITSTFVGPVRSGPVEIEVEVLRRGRSMSQLRADVRNPGASAGLSATAAFGSPRRGFTFTDAVPPEVPPPDELPSFRDPLPEGVDREELGPLPRFWEEILECKPARERPPWEPYVDGPAEVVRWCRIDEPPVLGDGTVDPLAALVVCDTMPSAVGQKVAPGGPMWFSPSVDLTLHLVGPMRPGWLLVHYRAPWAGDGYASGHATLWDPNGPDGSTLVAIATQVMLFTFAD